MTESLQLQFFNARTRSYVPDSCFEKPSTEAAKRLADIGRASGRSWRLAGPDRALKPTRATKARLTAGYSRSIADAQRKYLAWAQSKELDSVHVYADKLPPNSSPKFEYCNSAGERVTVPAVPVIFAGAMTTLTPEEQFAIVETVAPVMVPLRTVEGFYIRAGA